MEEEEHSRAQRCRAPNQPTTFGRGFWTSSRHVWRNSDCGTSFFTKRCTAASFRWYTNCTISLAEQRCPLGRPSTDRHSPGGFLRGRGKRRYGTSNTTLVSKVTWAASGFRNDRTTLTT